MDKLKVFYEKIENPIDNKSKWNQILSIYSTSYDYNDFEREITKVNTSVNPYYISDDKEKLSLIMWSIFKNKITTYDEEKIYDFKYKNIFGANIYDVIKKINEYGSIKEYSKLMEVLANEDIKWYADSFYTNENNNITIASNFEIANDYSYNTVLTVTVAAVNLYKFLIDYVTIATNKEQDFLIKFNECGKYIIINIYASIFNVTEVDDTLSVVMKENYGFHFDNIYNLLSGDIDDYISVKNRTYYNQNDYNNSRCLLLFKSFDTILYSYVLNHLDVIVSYKDGKMNLLDYICNNVTDRVLHELMSKTAKNKADYINIANSENLLKLRQFIIDKLTSNITDILNEKLYLKDSEYKVPLTINENKTFDIDASIFMYAIRTLTSALMMKDPSIETEFKTRLKNECLYKKVDPVKFCLDKSFTDKVLYNEDVMKAYEDELNVIKEDIGKLDELEGMFNGTATSEERQKIAANMKELLEHFGNE